ADGGGRGGTAFSRAESSAGLPRWLGRRVRAVASHPPRPVAVHALGRVAGRVVRSCPERDPSAQCDHGCPFSARPERSSALALPALGAGAAREPASVTRIAAHHLPLLFLMPEQKKRVYGGDIMWQKLSLSTLVGLLTLTAVAAEPPWPRRQPPPIPPQ